MKIRRSLLLLCLGVVSGTAKQKCSPTKCDMIGPFFVANVSKNFSQGDPLAQEEEINPAVVYGLVKDRDCKPIGGAEVEVWHAGYGVSGNMDEAFYSCKAEEKDSKCVKWQTKKHGFSKLTEDLWYRGMGKTDKRGFYKYLTVFPGVYKGRPIPHIHYKVTDKNIELVTQLYFEGEIPPTYENYVNGRETQFPMRDYKKNGIRFIRFDIVMDHAQLKTKIIEEQCEVPNHCTSC